MSGECKAWVYKQSQGFFLKGKLVEKMHGLVLTETERESLGRAYNRQLVSSLLNANSALFVLVYTLTAVVMARVPVC